MLCLYIATVSVTSKCIQYLYPHRYIIILVHKSRQVSQVQMTPQSLGYNDWGMLLAWETSHVPERERETERDCDLYNYMYYVLYTSRLYTYLRLCRHADEEM